MAKRSVPRNVLRHYRQRSADAFHVLEILTDGDPRDHGTTQDFFLLEVVSHPEMLRVKEEEGITAIGSETYARRRVPGLQGWKSYGATLDPLGRKVSTGAVEFVVAWSPVLAETLASTQWLNKAVNLYTLASADAPTTEWFDEIVNLHIIDIAQDGASVIVSCADGRDLDAQQLANRWNGSDHPYELVADVSRQGLSLVPSESNEHLMMQENLRGGGVERILSESGIQSNIFFGAPLGREWVQDSPTADPGERDPADFDLKDYVSNAMMHADAALAWQPGDRNPTALEFEFNQTPDFVLGPDEYEQFEQLSTYEDMINRVRVFVPDPSEPGQTWELLYLEDSTSQEANSVSRRWDANDRIQDHRVEMRNIGHSFFCPHLNSNYSITRYAQTFNFRASRSTWPDTGTEMTLVYPELCGFSGSSRLVGREISNERPAWFAVQSVAFETQGVAVSSGTTAGDPAEIVKATSYRVPPVSITTGAQANGTDITIPNSLDTITAPGPTRFRQHHRFGIYTVSRGERGTSAQDWFWAPVFYLYVWDVTMPLRAADRILARHANGVPRVRFRVSRFLGMQMEVGQQVSLRAARFIRTGRPIGAGLGGVDDIFEITRVQNEPSGATIEAAWVQGDGTVSITERTVTPSGRTPGRVLEPGTLPSLWKTQIEGSGETSSNGSFVQNVTDIASFLSVDDLLITVELDLYLVYNDPDVARTAYTVIRVDAELEWDASTTSLSVVSDQQTVVRGLKAGTAHTFQITTSGTQIIQTGTQNRTGWIQWSWDGFAEAVFTSAGGSTPARGSLGSSYDLTYEGTDAGSTWPPGLGSGTLSRYGSPNPTLNQSTSGVTNVGQMDGELVVFDGGWYGTTGYELPEDNGITSVRLLMKHSADTATGDATVVSWAKQRLGAGAEMFIEVQCRGNNSMIFRVNARNQATGGQESLNHQFNVTEDEWLLIDMVFDRNAGEARYYVNGDLEHTASASPYNFGATTEDGTIILGARANTSGTNPPANVAAEEATGQGVLFFGFSEDNVNLSEHRGLATALGLYP